MTDSFHFPTAPAALGTLALLAAVMAPATPIAAAAVDAPVSYSAPDAAFELGFLGSYETGQFDESAAEITAVHGTTVYTVNAQAATVDVIDAKDPKKPVKTGEITGTGIANSIDIRPDGLGVIALENETKTAPGSLLFFDANSDQPKVLGEVTGGSLPDMVTISPDGTRAIVANEGEPADDFSTDPEGSIGIVDLPAEVAAPSNAEVRIANFHDFESGGSKTLPKDIRVFGPNPDGDLDVSRNLEPEYITVAGGKAYATLQEANAIAVIDLDDASVTEILPLGFKDHGRAGNGLDASDRDPEDAPTINISEYQGLKGAYMPDTISTYSAGGVDYLVTANEGDSREWGDFVDAARAKDLGQDDLAPVCATSPLADNLGDDKLGRLNIITDLGLSESGDCYEELYAFGGRSFSIWTTEGELVADSGDSFEKVSAAAKPDFFNSNHSESNLEGRSDDKGPEPEALTIGEVDGIPYAFVGFERFGGVAAYDLSDPTAPEFVTLFNNRDFSVSVEDEIEDAENPAELLARAGDLGPESITFLGEDQSPTGEPALVVGNEVSGTTSFYSIANPDSGSEDPDANASDDPGANVSDDSDAKDGGDDTTADGAAKDANPTSDANADESSAKTQASSDDSSTGSAQDSAANSATSKDPGQLPRTGADLGQYLVMGGVALGLIVIGVIAFILTRRR